MGHSVYWNNEEHITLSHEENEGAWSTFTLYVGNLAWSSSMLHIPKLSFAFLMFLDKINRKDL